MHINKSRLIDSLKYYSLIIIFYLLELFLFNLMRQINFFQPEIFNFFIRFFMVLLTAFTIKLFVFKNSKNFFRIFFILSLINPFISSASLFFMYGVLGVHIILAKILGDIFTSLILLYVLMRFVKK